MKYIIASCYAVGAVLWPLVAGLMLGEGQIFAAGVLVAYSFIAYWKGYQWLKRRITSWRTSPASTSEADRWEEAIRRMKSSV